MASVQYDQYYHRLLYDRLAPVVEDVPLTFDDDGRPDERVLATCQLFHLHSPEDLPFGTDVGLHASFADALSDHGVRVVWTQHNFEPHDKATRATFRPVYNQWARRSHSLFHHSRWGMAQCQDRYVFSPKAQHYIVPHGHFGPLMPDLEGLDPRHCRQRLGLDPDLLCLGVIGHPRREKRVDDAVQAFARAGRSDLQLVVLSLSEQDPQPEHPRVVGLRHHPLPREEYNRRLRAIDVAVMPFAAGMLTTGSAADVIALGIPAIVSDWPYLAEVLGQGAIVYGSSVEDLAECLEALDEPRLRTARAATRALQSVYDYSAVARIALPALMATAATQSGFGASGL